MRIVWLDFDDTGTAVSYAPLMRALEARVLCPRAGQLAEALRGHAQEGMLLPFRGGYTLFLWLLTLRRLLKDSSDTILLTHGEQAALAAGWVRRVAPQTPVVMFLSGSAARPAVQWSRSLVQALARADQVCVVTRELAESLAARLKPRGEGPDPAERIRVVPPLAPEKDSVPDEPGEHVFQTGRTVFLSADDLVPGSGLSDLVDAMGLLQGLDGLPPWEVRVLGEGVEFEVLLDKARELKTEGPLALLGPQALEVQLPLAQVAVNTTRTSRDRMDFIFQAWAQGRALICSATPEAQAVVVDKVNGLLYPPGNAVALAALLARCLSEPDMLRQLALAGREALSGYSPEAAAGALRAACRDVLKKDQSDEK